MGQLLLTTTCKISPECILRTRQSKQPISSLSSVADLKQTRISHGFSVGIVRFLDHCAFSGLLDVSNAYILGSSQCDPEMLRCIIQCNLLKEYTLAKF